VTRTERKRIAQRHHNGWTRAEREDLLDGQSVAEFVAEARAGWPKVPVPKDPVAAAMKVRDKHADHPDLIAWGA